MEVKACCKFAKIGPRKTRLVADLIRGESVPKALEILRTTRRRASEMIEKVVKAAVAAASDQHDVEAEDLRVAGVWVDEGPQRKTFWARPRGMWARKIHRTSHIHVVLSDERPGAPEAAAAGEE